MRVALVVKLSGLTLLQVFVRSLFFASFQSVYPLPRRERDKMGPTGRVKVLIELAPNLRLGLASRERVVPASPSFQNGFQPSSYVQITQSSATQANPLCRSLLRSCEASSPNEPGSMRSSSPPPLQINR